MDSSPKCRVAPDCNPAWLSPHHKSRTGLFSRVCLRQNGEKKDAAGRCWLFRLRGASLIAEPQRRAPCGGAARNKKRRSPRRESAVPRGVLLCPLGGRAPCAARGVAVPPWWESAVRPAGTRKCRMWLARLKAHYWQCPDVPGLQVVVRSHPTA